MSELSAKAREARAAYYREWRRKNPDKVAEYDRKRWEKAADKNTKGDTSGEDK